MRTVISQASLRVASEALTLAQLSEYLGSPPTHGVDKGSPVSRRAPQGPVHQQSTWCLRSGVDGDDLLAHLQALEPVAERLSALRDAEPSVAVDLVLMIEAADTGNMLIVEPDTIAWLARFGVGLVLDAYNSSDGE